MKGPQIFLSHDAADAAAARRVREWLSDAFPHCTVFFAPADDSIPPGGQWWPTLLKAMRSADAFVVCLSRAYIARPWLLFESGVGVGRKVPVIPLLMDDTPFLALPEPLRMHQAVRFDKEGTARILKRLWNPLGYAGVPRSFPPIRSEPAPKTSGIKAGIYVGADRRDISVGWQRYDGNQDSFDGRPDGIAILGGGDNAFRYPHIDNLSGPWKFLAARIRRSSESLCISY